MKTNFTGKIITLFISLILLVCGGCFFMSAYAQQLLSVDLVIVLDDSGSMKSLGAKSDVEGYRYDAAAIMINLCEIYSSRAAVIRFNETPKIMALAGNTPVTLPVPINPLTQSDTINVKGSGNRSYFTKELTTLVKTADPQSNTYLGAALQKAIELLDAGAATRGANQPMILVLADGKSDDADAVEQARLDCLKKGYKIYTVLLINKNNTDFTSDKEKQTYKDLATTTGGTTFELADPGILPERFSEIFADQIGSLLIKQSDAEEQADGSFKLKINIPNRSVIEANVILQSEKLSNIRLHYPDGTEANTNSLNLFTASSDRFKIYKMVKPSTGIWNLEFNKTDNSVQNIAMNILFSYSVTLEGAIQTDAPYGKNTPVRLSAQFYESGKPSTDDLLYSQGIKAKLYFLAAGSALPAGGFANSNIPYLEMDAKADRFEKTFTLKDFLVNGNPVNQSGNYELYIYAQGDGLERTSEAIPFNVMNNPPVTKSGLIPKSIELIIDNPLEENIDHQDEYALDANAFISDLDADALTMRLTCGDDSLITLLDVDPNAMTARLQTCGAPGKTYIQVDASDTESSTLATPVVIPVTVTSIKDSLTAEYTPVINPITPLNSGGYYEKDSTFEFRVNIETNTNGIPDIDNYKAAVNAVHVKGDIRTGMDIPIALTQVSARVWMGSLQLAGNRASYPIQAVLSVDDNIVLGEANFIVNTGNEPPFALESNIARDAYIEPLPIFFQKQAASKPFTEDLNAFFGDSNPYDVLTFSIADFESDVISAELPDGSQTMTVDFMKSGTQSLSIIATDNSGESAALVYTVHVISYTQELIDDVKFYGPFAALAIILILIIWQILKPSFRGLMLQSTRNGIDHRESNIKATKHSLSLGLYADPVMLKDVGLDKRQLMGIKLKPGKKGIYVKRGKKPLNNATLTVDTVVFNRKKKKLRLAIGREIRITSNGNYISWQLKRVEKGGRNPARRTPPPNKRRTTQSSTGRSRR